MSTRILSFQRPESTHTESLFAALRQSGVEVVDAMFAGQWVLDNARRGAVALFHWPLLL